jgi:glycine cleavage system regulatory protein
MPGGIIVLEMNVHDYSLAHIARIVEDNEAKILSSHVASVADSMKMEVTLKINREDVTSIILSLMRYDYAIKASYMSNNRNEDVLHSHYEQLMMYLNV